MKKNLPPINLRSFALNCLLFVSVSFTAFLISFESSAQSVFIQDLNERENVDEFEFSGLTAGNGKVFVIVRNRELWTTYLASNNQDVIVKLGAYDSVANLTRVGNRVYFTARTADNGMELYRSDGTPQGTVLAKDINPGPGDSNPSDLVDMNGILYFSATNGTSGRELWKSNGTPASTVQIKDIFPKGASSNPTHLTNVNGTLFFAANDGVHGYELWKSNGNVAGTMLVKDIRSELRVSSSPDQLENVNGVLYFSATEAATGRELYKSDGTEAGTMLVKDIRAGAGGSNIANLTGNGSMLIFTANDGITGDELWTSDGTTGGTALVKDMTPGAAGSNGEQSGQFKMANFTSINGIVYYTAYERDTYMIWKTDGTSAGTTAIVPAYGAVNEQPVSRFLEMNGLIFFYNNQWPESWAVTLMRMNPDGSDHRWISETYIGYQQEVYSPELVKITDKNGANHLYFHGIVAFEGFKLLKSNGIDDYEGTIVLPDPYIPTASSNPHDFKTFKNKTFFIANPTWYDNQSLWAADESGIHEVSWFSYNGGEFNFTDNYVYASGNDWLEVHRSSGDPYSHQYIVEDYNAPPAVNLTGVKSKMFFTNANAELYAIDDATVEVTFLKDLENIYDFAAVGSNLVFRSKNSSNGEELWRSNGTATGTIRYKVISSSFQTPSMYRPMAIAKGVHYFVANDGVHGNEIWRTQATGASTYMLADLNTNDHLFIQDGKENDIRSMYEFRDSLYVSAVDNTGSWALYKTNGTAAGMTKVMNINQIAEMVEVQGKLYLFVVDQNDASKINIHVTNGTAQGTRFLFQIPTLQYSHAAVLNSLYVRAATGTNEVWRTDGTKCGTFSFDLGVEADIEIGEYGTSLIFGGLHPDKGVEPYKFDTAPFLSQCEQETLAANESMMSEQLMQGNEELTSVYPNPFQHELVLRVAGEDSADARVEVYSISGLRVDDLGTLKCNTDYSVGSAWPHGMYILKINAGGKLSTQKVIKKK